MKAWMPASGNSSCSVNTSPAGRAGTHGDRIPTDTDGVTAEVRHIGIAAQFLQGKQPCPPAGGSPPATGMSGPEPGA